MRLGKLLADLPLQTVIGSQEIEITGITADSRAVQTGFLFVAKKGGVYDGAKYIPQAIDAGAAAILTDSAHPIPSHIVQIIPFDMRVAEGKLAAAYYQFPSDHLFIAGVTGTSGKTTTSYLVRHLLEEEGVRCGLIGGVVCSLGKGTFPSILTTPDVITNHQFLHEMVQNGCEASAMEVSSHGLEQGRVDQVHFDAAVFTNLTPEHLDYHLTMEAYGAVKAKLFQGLRKEAHAIVNADDPIHSVMVKGCAAQILTYGIENDADVQASDIRFSLDGVEFNVEYQGRRAFIASTLIGRFNVYNILAAIAVALARGIDLSRLASSLRTFKKVPGRLERVPNQKGLSIFVDHAHKYDALKNVLETLQKIKKGRLITLFGCGGDRDREKRPKMGAVAEQFSDQVVITSDNPRSEEPQAIIDQILTGILDRSKVIVEKDRRKAIERVLQMATPDDLILIAGKGHETYQIFHNQTIHFDDREVIQQLLVLHQA